MEHWSVTKKESASCAGVSFTLRRMSLGRRIELSRLVGDLASKLEFSEAGSSFADKVDASRLALEIDRLYIRWGIAEIEGLTLDAEPATVERAIDAGPETLCQEMAAAVRGECGLSESERKN